MNPCCDLDLEDSKQFFVCFWHGTLAHDAASQYKFGNKMFCGSENIIWTNIHEHFQPLQ